MADEVFNKPEITGGGGGGGRRSCSSPDEAEEANDAGPVANFAGLLTADDPGSKCL